MKLVVNSLRIAPLRRQQPPSMNNWGQLSQSNPNPNDAILGMAHVHMPGANALGTEEAQRHVNTCLQSKYIIITVGPNL